jgi:hypothetical protein
MRSEPMSEAVTTHTRLLVVREVRENKDGATISLRQGGHGCLSLQGANYASQLRCARRSQERQHPVGVRFADAHAITELIRTDNDAPAQLREEGPDGVRVLFQGHEGGGEEVAGGGRDRDGPGAQGNRSAGEVSAVFDKRAASKPVTPRHFSNRTKPACSK